MRPPNTERDEPKRRWLAPAPNLRPTHPRSARNVAMKEIPMNGADCLGNDLDSKLCLLIYVYGGVDWGFGVSRLLYGAVPDFAKLGSPKRSAKEQCCERARLVRQVAPIERQLMPAPNCCIV